MSSRSTRTSAAQASARRMGDLETYPGPVACVPFAVAAATNERIGGRPRRRALLGLSLERLAMPAVSVLKGPGRARAQRPERQHGASDAACELDVPELVEQ